MLLFLTTADRAACVPLFIHLRKYHPKPHLSCIGCSLTFHFVWQTLIFTSKVLSRRHPTHTYLLCCLSRGCFRRNCRNTHKHTYKETLEITTLEGSLKYCQICWIRTLVGIKCMGDKPGLIKAAFHSAYSCSSFKEVLYCTVISMAACNPESNIYCKYTQRVSLLRISVHQSM